jgi:mannose-6-phosphate isomerase-like protein (cupin superfamily)
MQVIDLISKFNLFKDFWSPKVVAELNDHQLKIAKIKGEFVSHKHDNTDEAFIVIKGEMFMKLESHTVRIREGEMCVVKKNITHKPFAPEECWIMLVEMAGTRNTGDAKDFSMPSTEGVEI